MVLKRWIFNNKPEQKSNNFSKPLFRKKILRNELTTFDILKFKYIFFYLIIEIVNIIELKNKKFNVRDD